MSNINDMTPYTVALLLTMMTASSHAVVIYDWSFQDVDQGGNNTISGTFTLPDLCLTSCAARATSVILNTAPFGPLGFDFVLANGGWANTFIVENGSITLLHFYKYDDLDTMFGLLLSYGFAGGQGLADFDVAATDGIFGTGDGSSLVFSQRLTAIPEPVVPGLILLGLGVMARHRRNSRL